MAIALIAIGKSLFGLYLVSQLLEHRYPAGQVHHVVWQLGRSGEVWLFDITSPQQQSQPNLIECWEISKTVDDHHLVIVRNENTVCIFDAPRPLYNGTAGKAVLLTSPKDKEDAKEFNKGAEKLWMPSWTVEEMEAAREHIYNDPAAQQRYTALYKYYGNNPRHVFGEHTASGFNAEEQARQAVQEQVETMRSPTELLALIRALAVGIIRNDQSHLLMHMHSRHPYDLAYPQWPSAYVSNLVMSHLTTAYNTKLQLFLAATRGVGEYGALRGLMFEWFAHQRLAAGGVFTIESLADKATQQLVLLRSDVVYWNHLKELRNLSDHQYAVPISRSQGAFDAAQKPARLFQMTVSTSHTVSTYHTKEGAEQLCPRIVPQFIFVVPADIYEHFKGRQKLVNKGRAEKEAAPKQLGVQTNLSGDETVNPPQLIRDMKQWKLALPYDLVLDQASGRIEHVKTKLDELVAAALHPDVDMHQEAC